MAVQRLQSVPEMIDGHKVEEAEMNTEETDMNKEETGKEDEDEEFYERIEAPKFVDFTKPNPFRPDDRYWFCSRVGCDQKHEEEIDPEEISKNFVLRVLAARSPNIKLQKALNGKHSSMKCPLSAPAKPSKPRIPRLAMVSSSISHKIGDPESKIKPPSKAGSTPVAKSRQVAAKYMTTPRNKKCLPNPNSFRSVQNPKTTIVHAPKNRTVAKALTFNSPKKAINLKKSVELHTPLKKICEGMKRLAITSQKKTSKGIRNNPKKPETEDSTRRQLRVQSKDLLPSKSTKINSKKILTPKCHPLNEQVVEKESSVDTIDVKLKDSSTLGAPVMNGGIDGHEEQCLPSDSTKKEEGLQVQETSETKMNVLTKLEDKENTGSAEDHSNDDKENALSSEDNNREFNNQPLGDKILGKETDKKNKVVRTLDKNLKGGPAVVKYKKPKTTNIKPFRLRTDERGILKEAILERKLQFPAPEKEVAKDTSVIKRTHRIQKNEKFSTEQTKHNESTIHNCGKESGGVIGTNNLKTTRGQVGSKPATIRRIHPESTHQKHGSMTSLRIRSPYLQRQPQGITRPGQRLGVLKEKSSKVTVDVMGTENKTRSTSTKLAETVAKEPNFHSSHLPRSCSKKIA